MKLRTLMFIIVTTLSAWGCASSRPDLSRVRVGQDKDQVLQVVGDPKRTFRAGGQDHWIYVDYEGDAKITHSVDFADGRVVRVSRPSSTSNLERELENAATLEEFEAKARAHQKRSKLIDASVPPDKGK